MYRFDMKAGMGEKDMTLSNLPFLHKTYIRMWQFTLHLLTHNRWILLDLTDSVGLKFVVYYSWVANEPNSYEESVAY